MSASNSKALLIENEEIINESAKVANFFSSYFESLTESLDLFNWAPEPYDQAKDLVGFHITLVLLK